MPALLRCQKRCVDQLLYVFYPNPDPDKTNPTHQNPNRSMPLKRVIKVENESGDPAAQTHSAANPAVLLHGTGSYGQGADAGAGFPRQSYNSPLGAGFQRDAGAPIKKRYGFDGGISSIMLVLKITGNSEGL